MVLTAGTRLGPYEIQNAIGAGGMGEVYRARDTRLDRTVAIKVLTSRLAADPEFRERFDREARSIAQLNHAHICTLYDTGSQDDVSFLVMEYLEGETLAARLVKGPLPVDGTIDYALEIADALDKAHRRAIVHRDLKPANVMLTKTGTKLLDFGLAKIGPSPTLGTLETKLASTPPDAAPRGGGAGPPLTSQGSLLGTFQYMAPEQLEGREVDGRADIWAFGCVLYEMLTGKRAFEGRTQASLVASILEREPTPVTELQPMTPPALARVVRTCLAKDPDNRFQTARDLWLQLQWIEEGGSAAGLPAPVVSHRRHRELAWGATGALALAAIAGSAAWWLKPAPPETHVVTRLAFSLAEDQVFSRIGRRFVAISPDGTMIVYVANRQLYLRSLDRLEAEPLRGTNVDPLEPVFSPDGRWIAFFVPGDVGNTGTLRKISVSGGAPVKLADVDQPYGVTWQHGLIAFGQNTLTRNEIDVVSDTGGTVRPLVSLAAQGRAIQPWLFDDARHLLFVVLPPTSTPGATPDEASEIFLEDLDTGRRSSLVRGGTSPQILPTGHLLYVHDATLLVTPFDLKRLTITGGPTPVVDGVNETLISWTGQFSVSRTGTLVYSPGRPSGDPRELVWVDRQGRERRIGAPPHAYLHPHLSPDGSKIAVDALDEESDIWVWDVRKEFLTRLTFGPAQESSPVWMSDSRRVIFRSLEPGATTPDIFWKAADGTGPLEQLTTHGGGGEPSSISPGDRSLVFRTTASVAAHPWALRLLPLAGGGPVVKLLEDSRFNQASAEISPDGHWIAYQSSESSHIEVLVRPFPDVDSGRWQVSSGGGQRPAWSRSGLELFYESGNHLIARSVQPGPPPTFGQPQLLLDLTPYALVGGPARRYDVAPDGTFLFTKPLKGAAPASQTIVVVSNWFDELKARIK